MIYARIISKLYGQQLLLELNAWLSFDHAFRNVMSGIIPVDRVHPDESTDRPPARHERILEFPSLDTAVIYIDGVIDKHVSMLDLVCYGGVDLDDVDAALAQVAADDRIRNVMLVFNSPGGGVIGVPETAERIYQLTRTKNVKAFSDSICCSGAIYLGSQASEFFITQSTYSGSIGVIMPPIIDISQALEEQGVKVTIIKSGKYKDMGSPFRAITKDEVKMLTDRSNKIYDMFATAVERGRPEVTSETMQGQTFFGDEAVARGLADAVLPDLDAALGQF